MKITHSLALSVLLFTATGSPLFAGNTAIEPAPRGERLARYVEQHGDAFPPLHTYRRWASVLHSYSPSLTSCAAASSPSRDPATRISASVLSFARSTTGGRPPRCACTSCAHSEPASSSFVSPMT